MLKKTEHILIKLSHNDQLSWLLKIGHNSMSDAQFTVKDPKLQVEDATFFFKKKFLWNIVFKTGPYFVDYLLNDVKLEGLLASLSFDNTKGVHVKVLELSIIVLYLTGSKAMVGCDHILWTKNLQLQLPSTQAESSDFIIYLKLKIFLILTHKQAQLLVQKLGCKYNLGSG